MITNFNMSWRQTQKRTYCGQHYMRRMLGALVDSREREEGKQLNANL